MIRKTRDNRSSRWCGQRRVCTLELGAPALYSATRKLGDRGRAWCLRIRGPWGTNICWLHSPSQTPTPDGNRKLPENMIPNFILGFCLFSRWVRFLSASCQLLPKEIRAIQRRINTDDVLPACPPFGVECFNSLFRNPHSVRFITFHRLRVCK